MTDALIIATELRDELLDIDKSLRLELQFVLGTEREDKLFDLRARLQSVQARLDYPGSLLADE